MAHHPSVETGMSAVTLAQGFDYNKEAEIQKYFIGAQGRKKYVNWMDLRRLLWKMWVFREILNF